MTIDKLKKYFAQYNLQDRIKEFAVSSATVELAAIALNCDAKRIAKTLSFVGNPKPILIVAAGDARIDNSKFKSQFGFKAKFLTPEEVTLKIGYTIGGVCPFLLDANIDVYLDKSLERFTTVFPACGSSNSAIELTLEELQTHSNFTSWIDVCKDWQ
jgi:prolyl-tRNA editing enzyme YbaK/EbsC (Cys-tRNA(Pro) deacylase)